MNARYGTNPEFRMISAGGPTSVSDETSLPNANGKTKRDSALPPRDKGSDITAWEALGYTPARYEAAWQAVFAMYGRIFFATVHVPGALSGAPDRKQRR